MDKKHQNWLIFSAWWVGKQYFHISIYKNVVVKFLFVVSKKKQLELTWAKTKDVFKIDYDLSI